jgi:hypothetical protein
MLSALATLSVKAQSVTVYQSDIGQGGVNYALQISSGVQTGDEITLSGGAAAINGFSFSYIATGLNGGATADVKFYDGATGSTTPLYDTGPFSVGNAANGETLNFNAASLGGGFASSGDIKWTVTATYTTGSFGLFYGTPSIGGGYQDYVVLQGGAWDYRQAPGTAIGLNAASSFTAVPEPSTFALLGMGGFAAMMLIRRRN